MSAHLRTCPCCRDRIMVYRRFRIFQGAATKQVDARGKMASPSLWYFEPDDYEEDLLWSIGFPNVDECKSYIDTHLEER